MLRSRYDVFLSYSRSDTTRVQPLLNELKRLGYRVFFDMQSIIPGEDWKKRLERSVRASRTMVLCWSKAAQESDYIRYEFSSALAQHKRVFPWLLDGTPLPAMLEIQGIKEQDAGKAASALRPQLGVTLKRRWMLQSVVAAIMLLILTYAVWRHMQPPPPWQFQGRVYDHDTSMPVAGVEVVVDPDDNNETIGKTNDKGEFTIMLPAPRPDSLRNVLFRKDGYAPEEKLNVMTDDQFKVYITKR
ncbi:MAG: TIR domain-containing protein [Terracidiphilus sp.]|jgi:hypothetical protein